MEYRIASNPGDYQKAQALMKAEGVHKNKLTFPTILAVDEDQRLIGMLGTMIKDKMIVAGPLVVLSDRLRAFTVIRLIDAYENVMRMAGVKTYIFGVEASNKKWLEYIKDVGGLEPYAEDEENLFFVRKVQ